MATILEALAVAVQHHQSGQLQAAEQIYRQILVVEPDQADALHLLGVVASQMGDHQAAIHSIRRAIEINGTDAAFHCNLAAALKAQGMFDEAVAACRRALELDPDSAEAHGNLGNALKELGALNEAVAAYRRALELEPAHAETYYNLGNAFQAQEKSVEAIASYRRALELKPDYAEALSNLGTALNDQGKIDEAIACFRRALELNPRYAEAYNNLGTSLQDQGKLDEAVVCFRRALELKPNYVEAHCNLGTAVQGQGYLDDAIASYRRAIDLKGDNAGAHSNLGTAVHDQGKLNEAIASYRRALDLKGDYAEAYNNLGTAFQAQGKLDDAMASYRQAVELKPGFAEAYSNLLFTLQYQAGSTPIELSAAHGEYERRFAASLQSSWRPHENDRDPERRLRLGFISPDFGQHPIGFFLIPILKNLDSGGCEMICYNDRIIQDDLTARLQSAATTWREVRGLRDQELCEQIRADRIDILFDLAGHTAKNRLLVFARQPAPIQITWAGYAGTTGLAAMDYILADRWEIPEEAEAHYCERVLRMPDGYVCYAPPPYAPGVSSLPALAQRFVTFGSFNNRAKITPQVVELWARILSRLPESRLVLKNKGMDDTSVTTEFAQAFARQGIDPKRIECLGWSPHATLLAEYSRLDLALDPFPYNGGLTTCEALWMGVPVITCPGETFASRHSLSHLSNVGLTETIARDWDEYIELAVSLATDLPRLAALRGGLRARMAASPLCDGRRFADNLLRILRDAWREWCHEAPS